MINVAFEWTLSNYGILDLVNKIVRPFIMTAFIRAGDNGRYKRQAYYKAYKPYEQGSCILNR